MENKLSKEILQFIISRVVENASSTLTESKNENNDFLEGKSLAYYEVLDIIKNELDAHDQNLKDYGLDINLEETFL